MSSRWTLVNKCDDLSAGVYMILEEDGLALYSRPEQSPDAWIATCDTRAEARQAARAYLYSLMED